MRSELELEYEWELDPFLEGEGIWNFIRRRALPALRRYGTIGRIVSLTMHPLHDPAVVREPPPVVAVEERKKPRQGQYPPSRESEALMEHFAAMASETESEASAEAFIGALVPLAARLASGAGRSVLRSAPGIVRGLTGATRLLRQTPATRQLVRTLPFALRQTVAAAARQAAAGDAPGPAAMTRLLARSMAGTLADPRKSEAALRRSLALTRNRC